MSPTPRALVLGLALIAGGVGAQQSRPVDRRSVSVTGVVERGSCARALTLRTNAGERYELDTARTALKIGDRGTYAGTLYPRISICNAFAWLDVAKNAVTVQTSRAINEQKPAASERETTVMLVSSRDQLEARLREAKQVKGQLPEWVKVIVGLRSAEGETAHARWQILAQTLIEITNKDWDLLDGVPIQVIESRTPDGVIQHSPTGERAFPNMAAFLTAWNRENRRPT